MPDERGKYLPGEGGRPKGVPNKTTREVKEMLLQCFEKRGGLDAMLAWSNANPDLFYQLWAKLLPHQIVGADGGEVTIRVVTGIEASPEKSGGAE